MKNKYYAMINGEEMLVRTTTKSHYKYACLRYSCFAETKEEVLKRVHSEVFTTYNYAKKYGVRKKVGDEYVSLKGKEAQEQLELMRTILQQEYDKAISNIVEVYIK